MKRFVLLLSLISCAVVFIGCGGSSGPDAESGGKVTTGIFAFLGGVFVAWSFPFWVLVIACTLFEFRFVESDEPNAVGATLTFVITAILMLACGNAWFFEWMNQEGWTAWAKLIALAVLPGIPWFFFKWKVWTLKCGRTFTAEKRRWLEENAPPAAENLSVPDQLRDKWTAYLNERGDLYPEYPKYSEHKRRIMAWGIYWPFSILATLLKDLLWDFWEHVVEWCGKTLNQMSKASYSGIEADVDKTKLRTRRYRY